MSLKLQNELQTRRMKWEVAKRNDILYDVSDKPKFCQNEM